jgi:hypothetical protein
MHGKGLSIGLPVPWGKPRRWDKNIPELSIPGPKTPFYGRNSRAGILNSSAFFPNLTKPLNLPFPKDGNLL